jgi:Flp pilus assembly protein TadD
MHIERALQLDGDNPAVIARLAAAYLVLGDGETSLRLAGRAAQLYPHALWTHFALGSAYLALGRTGDAVGALEDQVGFSGRDTDRCVMQVLLGACHWLEGNPVKAEAAIDRALAIGPNWDMALTWKAILVADRGDEEAAREVMLRARTADLTRTIDQHARRVFRFPALQQRYAGAAAILRGLWDETEGHV